MIDRQSFLISGGFHLLLILVLLVGLPTFKKEIPPSRVIAVSMVPIDSITQSPQRIQKKLPSLSEYKKPTYKVGKPIVAPVVQKKIIEEKPVPLSPKPARSKTPSPVMEKTPISEDKPKKISEISRTETPKAEKKSSDPFESVLQSVQQFETSSTPSEHKTTDPRAFEADLISSKISLSELDALRQQLKRCWLVPPAVLSEKEMTIEAEVDIDSRGYVTNLHILNQKDAQKFRSFREGVQSVRQALKAPECSPLKLPADKHYLWKKCILRFSPRGIG